MTDSVWSLHPDVARELPIVGIGASAGGLEALAHLFREMDEHPGLAFVVVQHISPDLDTTVDELLGRQSRLTIELAQNETRVEPDTVYVMPPGTEMIIAERKLLLTAREPDGGPWSPVDAFFRSLAEDVGAHAVGIILSGTGSDGARGLRAIREAGGLTLVQDPRTAQFDGMPRSAIDAGIVDLVLPPGDMRHALHRHATRMVERDSLVGVAPAASDGASMIFDLLHQQSGVDFSSYKTTTIGRRLDRRLLLTGAPDLDAYVARVRDDPAERDALYQDLLIGVTGFYREPQAFELLSRSMLTQLIHKLPEDQELRVWCAGCATGEEAYSLAIATLECFRELDVAPRLRVFATDVYPRSLEVASTGLYPVEHVVAGVPAALFERYFTVEGPLARVRSEVRSHVVFARHNLLRDAPFTRLDLVSCRNVLIYLKPVAQKKMIGLFHFALRAGGVLFLGASEAPSALDSEFVAMDRRCKIYRKRGDVRMSAALDLPAPHPRRALARAVAAPDPRAEAIDRARDALLDRYAPPSLLVSSAHSLVHTFHGGNHFLRTPEGPPSLQILDLVEGELRYALAGALKRAADEHRQVVYERVPVRLPSGADKVRLSVAPLDIESNEHFLITLEPQESPVHEERIVDADELARERIESLELELRYARESLQATIEEMETSNEELQTTNEQLFASNEELYAANEELQSVNQELQSVNAEHQLKIRQLRELSLDMEHLLVATEVHALFLDNKLCLRKFTPMMGVTFRIRDADVGRRVDDFVHSLVHDDLVTDLERVLATGERLEREVRDRSGTWYLLRILPYGPQAEVTGIEGVVLTLINITSVKTVQRALGERDGIIHGFLEHSPVPLWAKDRQGRYLLMGRAAAQFFARDADDAGGGSTHDLVPYPRSAELQERELRVLATGEWEEEELDLPDGIRTFHAIRFPLRDADGAIYAVGGVGSDITDRKRAEEQARQAVERRDRFLAMLSHELRNPLAAIANGLHLLEEERDEGRRKRTHGIVKHQLSHLSKLLDDLLDVARVVQGRMRVCKETFVLNEVIKAAAATYRLKFADKRIIFEMRITDHDLVVQGDPTRIEQVLVELLHNASKFTPPGGTVELILERRDAYAYIRVSDTGAGLTPEEHSRVFELFYQRDDSMDRRDSGLGVGLPLARDLVESHGGMIRARSEGPNRGTEVIVELPLARAAVQTSTSEEALAPPPASLRVVIVEDSEDSLELLQLFLEHLGHTTFAAETGTAGLVSIQSHRPDIALVDIGLPGMSGLDVARAVREDPEMKTVYLVALTGYGRPEDRKASSDAGFDEHITKPVSRDALERVLKEAAIQRQSGT